MSPVFILEQYIVGKNPGLSQSRHSDAVNHVNQRLCCANVFPLKTINICMIQLHVQYIQKWVSRNRTK